MSVDDEVSAVSETSLPVVDKDNTEKSMTGIGSDVKIDPDGSFDSQCSLYSERSKKRRYKGKKDKKPGITGRTWKKVEDPHAPRKPRSGYVHFLSSRRSRYGTVKQGCDQKTINVALAAEWQSLSEDERRPFIELANKEREQYQIEMKAYEQTDHYREFIEKKERIMKLRKQRRRLGMDSQDEFDESLEFDDTFPEDVKKKIKIENTDKHIIELDEVVNPTLPNTAIPIFSQEFLEYNKNREAKLRSLRREISVAEAEKAAIQRTIEKMQENNIAYESQAAYDKKMAKEADRIIECWMRVLRAAMSETMKEYHLNTPEETVEFLTKLADGDAPNEDVLQVVKEVIHSASFLLQK
ncbi:HMG box [Dictyocaulus viviparus]|uniref:HMG box n=1 Tax=Dictyocaulus viviparus TaxID=29172 RepID=A0A0D8XTV3_DICVI|nr:HMG box [Dictyocaulus viviparus]